MVIISYDPATTEKIGEVKEFSIDEVKEAFRNAREAQIKWQEVPLKERAKRVGKINNYILEHNEEISTLLSKEVGKPKDEGFISEVFTAIDSTFHYYSKVEEYLAQENIDLGFYSMLKKRSYLIRKPAGVVAVIGPYNYPFVIPIEQIVQSLMGGNAVIFKPSSETVLVGQKIQEIFDLGSDLPKGLIQTVFGRGRAIGDIIIDEADRVAFTGSTETGVAIMRRAAETLTPVSLELGGKSAMIVLDDADINRAVSAARWGCFTNSGQVCASVKRLYIHESIAEKFTSELVESTKQLRQGLPLNDDVDIGAMVNEYQMKKILEMIEYAKEEGAEILCGGRRNPNFKGYFIEPTILGGCKNDMKCVQEEIFGPVLPIIRFKKIKEVIKMANDNKFGLSASVWSSDIKKAEEIATCLKAGSIMVNDCVYCFGLAATPWGGIKASGIGRSHGKYGFHEVTDLIHINIDQSTTPEMWWMPYNKKFKKAIKNFRATLNSFLIKE